MTGRGAEPAGAGRRTARPSPGAADRVPRSHAQTRVTLRSAFAFVVAAAVAAAAGGPRWLALHLFLAGGLVLAISAVSLMLTVTWSAAPAPGDRAVAVQRGGIALGAAGVSLARAVDAPGAVVALAGAVYLSGLALLAVLLVRTVRRGVERRFDVAVAYYGTALGTAAAAAVLGAVMALDGVTTSVRAVHVTLNLLGLLGLVVAGTVPFFAATVVRARMSPRVTPRRLLAILIGQVSALVVVVAGLLAADGPVAATGFAAYALGVGAVMWYLPVPTRRQLEWAGPRLLGLWAGLAWWLGAVVATATEAAGDPSGVFRGRWLLVLVVAGYGQVLWASLAYLLPMLRGGGHQHLSAGFAATRSWIGLVALNLAGAALALGAPSVVAGGAVAVAVIDGVRRATRVGTRPAARPEPKRSGPAAPAC